MAQNQRIEEMELNNEQLKQKLKEIKEEGERRVEEGKQKLEHTGIMFQRKIKHLHDNYHQLNNTIEVNETRHHLKSLNEFMGHMDSVITSLRSLHVHLPTGNINSINYHLEEFKEAMKTLTSVERQFHRMLLDSSSHREAVHVVLLEFTSDFQSISSSLPNHANYSKKPRAIKANRLEFHITLLQGFRDRGMTIMQQFSNIETL
ncbi:hypothetical protein CAEBREN_05991 [Caenorhabditis brenneri]|uniref:Uncharacterized protein n=1 Tax=Caenorhabditis brenneri TaxID=135651 RepID=G0NBE7_CAEBE|nr:hypothetical protein CAEBREN_05991 [Caenorhabditis brenneri]